jgi:hypothetical protein
MNASTGDLLVVARSAGYLLAPHRRSRRPHNGFGRPCVCIMCVGHPQGGCRNEPTAAEEVRKLAEPCHDLTFARRSVSRDSASTANAAGDEAAE